jgi:predicted HAD superfamily phosphohydrolase
MTCHHLIASDFDQTLSFNDSGAVLSELIGASHFREKVEGLAATNLVQQGGELAYLIRHDPEFLEARLGTDPRRTIYIGDGSSDVHVMLHVNNRGGFTIAVSENPLLASIARRSVLSDSALAVAVPILEHVAARPLRPVSSGG